MQINSLKKTKPKRDLEHDKRYDSGLWRKIRIVIFERDGYRCQPCKRKGLVTTATVVDHINPVKLGGSFDDPNNLESNCVSCHQSKSSGERRFLTKKK